MYGTPYPPFYMPPQRGLTIEDIRDARKQLKELEDEMKGEKDKEKKKKPEPVRFTFIEVFGLLNFFAIPIVLGQLWLLDYVKHALYAIK